MKTGGYITHAYKLWLLHLLHRLGTFKEASIAAGISQSAFSQNMTQLETLFQKRLYIKSRGRVSFSEFGLRVVQKVGPLLEQLEGENLIDIPGNTKFKKISIAAYESMAALLIPHLLSDIRRTYPELKVQIETHRSETIDSLVSKGVVDFGLVVNPVSKRGVTQIELGESRLGVFIGTQHPLFHLTSIKNKNNNEIEVIDLFKGDGSPPPFQKKIKSFIDSHFKSLIHISSYEVILQIVLKGTYAGVLPTWVAMRHAESLKPLPIPKEIEKSTLHKLCLIYKSSLESDLTRSLSAGLKRHFY